MSGRGSRPQQPSGHKGTLRWNPLLLGDPSTLPATAGAGAAQAPVVQLSSLLNPASVAANPPYTIQPPLQSGRESGPQQTRRALSSQPGQRIGTVTSGGTGSQQSGRAAYPQASQGAAPPRRMDTYRWHLIKDIRGAEQTIKRGQSMLLSSNSDAARARGGEFVNQTRERAAFLINDGRDRAKRLLEQFRTSYNPLLRDAGVPGQEERYYASSISQIFHYEADPTKRLQTFQALLSTVRVEQSSPPDKVDLYCEHLLAYEEQQREVLAGAGRLETRNSSGRESSLDSPAAEGGATAQASGLRRVGPSNQSRKRMTPEETRSIPGSVAGIGAVGATLSEIAITPATQGNARRARTSEPAATATAASPAPAGADRAAEAAASPTPTAAGGAGPAGHAFAVPRSAQTAGPSSGRDRRKNKAPKPAPAVS